ncbi:MAG: LLM class F420-dependent oxidoreductase [Anaerolineae bacterium]
MRIGLQIPNFTYPGSPALRDILKQIAQTADDGGFYSLWVMDHHFQIGFVGAPELEMLEAYSTLSYFAGVTEKVKLGALVTGVVYRYPGILVKTVTTLDVLSGGRAYLGIGAAWFEQEAKGLGTPFPPTGVRFEQLEETLQIAHQMWSDNNGAYNGKHFQLAETLCSPQPVSNPHPPIMIGGTGEKKTLRFVAQYGDACNLFDGMGWEMVQQKLDVLKQHCADVGRPYEQIEKTTLGSITPKMSRDQILEHIRKAADAGVQHMIFNMPHVHEVKPVEMVAKDIIPEVAAW